jgi:hypothetical protein
MDDTVRSPEQVKAWLAATIKGYRTKPHYDDRTKRMRWLVAGKLDDWLGHAARRYLINHLFPDVSDGSTSPLRFEQLAALLDWMALDHDPLNGYRETPESARAKEEMQAILAERQPL